MSRKIKFLLSLGICFLSAVILSKVAQELDQRKHPLVSSLTCIETADSADLYWKINQIAASGFLNPDKRSACIILSNTIPHFESYWFRIDGNEQWQQSRDGRIVMEACNGPHTVELKATTAMGGEVPSMIRTIDVSDHAVAIKPDAGKIESSRHGFRFERPASEKILWLREHLLPVIAACPDQWSIFLTLRTWVREQIPNRHPVMKSRWDAQRILQAVWNDPSIGFMCDAYAATYVSACVSLGLNARMIHLGDDQYNGHYAAEIWSDEHDKWIFMDPLYDRHFSLPATPLSAVELHNVWKQGRMQEIAAHGQGGAVAHGATLSRDYVNLFQDIQLVTSNDFLTAPFSSVMDLFTLKIRFLRYIDESNPPYDRIALAGQLFTFYYLPIFITSVIIPFVIPVFLIFMTMRLGGKREYPDGDNL